MIERKITEWYTLSKKLKQLRAQEMDMRKEIIESLIPHAMRDKDRITVKGETELIEYTAIQSTGYTLNDAVLSTVWDKLSDVEQNAIKMKPALKLREYKALGEDNLLAEAITTKWAAPTITAKLKEV